MFDTAVTMIAPRSFQFASFKLDLVRLCLLGPGGQVDLRPKSFEVLRYLVEHTGRVIGKEELIGAIWPDVTVTDESLTRCISEVRHALDDASQQIIKTVPRRGYLFDVPVAVDAVAATPARQAAGAGAPDPSLSSANHVPQIDRDAPAGERKHIAVLALPDKPTIAVLPFTNFSGDPEQEYFADGMVEEIITALSRIRWLFVIARNSSFIYKGHVVDVKQVGRELGVRYVLEGSVRKA